MDAATTIWVISLVIALVVTLVVVFLLEWILRTAKNILALLTILASIFPLLKLVW